MCLKSGSDSQDTDKQELNYNILPIEYLEFDNI